MKPLYRVVKRNRVSPVNLERLSRLTSLVATLAALVSGGEPWPYAMRLVKTFERKAEERISASVFKWLVLLLLQKAKSRVRLRTVKYWTPV